MYHYPLKHRYGNWILSSKSTKFWHFLPKQQVMSSVWMQPVIITGAMNKADMTWHHVLIQYKSILTQLKLSTFKMTLYSMKSFTHCKLAIDTNVSKYSTVPEAVNRPGNKRMWIFRPHLEGSRSSPGAWWGVGRGEWLFFSEIEVQHCTTRNQVIVDLVIPN